MTEFLSQSRTNHAFDTILVPLDGSPLAERALPYAEMLALARAGDPGHIVLVRVLEEDDTEAEASEYLVAIAERLRKRGLESEIDTARGKPGGEIVAEVGRRGAETVVMATHGRSGLGRWVYGSVAESVLDRAAVPVLLARAWAEAPPTTQSVRGVLVPLDGSPFAEAALPLAAAFASNRVDTELHLQQIVQPVQSLFTSWAPGVVYSDLDMATDLNAARTYLKDVVERLERELGVPASQAVIHALVGLPADTIVQTAREQRCDLIVMATHGHTGVARVVLGSVADAVLRGGSTPVLLVRPRVLTDRQPRRPGQLDPAGDPEG
jgi:nucleotide-binding universal stress UspA family protein